MQEAFSSSRFSSEVGRDHNKAKVRVNFTYACHCENLQCISKGMLTANRNLVLSGFFGNN